MAAATPPNTYVQGDAQSSYDSSTFHVTLVEVWVYVDMSEHVQCFAQLVETICHVTNTGQIHAMNNIIIRLSKFIMLLKGD